MCIYLAKRNATYYFRRVIPAELRPAFNGRGEFMLSLRTKERETAKRLVPDKTKETDRLLDEARARLRTASAPLGPRPPTMHELSEFDMEQMELRDQDEAERQARWETREPLRRRLEAAFEKSTALIEPWEAAARDLLRDLREELSVEQERKLLRRVRRAEERRGIGPEGGPEAAPQSPSEAAQRALREQRGELPAPCWIPPLSIYGRLSGGPSKKALTPIAP